MSTDNETKIKNASWALRVGGLAGWTVLWVMLWVLWVGTMANDPNVAGDDTALIMATCMATGCAGGAWFMGLCVFAVIYAVIRR
jgi:hypothetical protein